MLLAIHIYIYIYLYTVHPINATCTVAGSVSRFPLRASNVRTAWNSLMATVMSIKTEIQSCRLSSRLAPAHATLKSSLAASVCLDARLCVCQSAMWEDHKYFLAHHSPKHLHQFALVPMSCLVIVMNFYWLGQAGYVLKGVDLFWVFYNGQTFKVVPVTIWLEYLNHW